MLSKGVKIYNSDSTCIIGISAIFSQLIFKVCFHFYEILFLYRPFYHSCCTICLQSFEAHFTIFCLVFFTKQLFCPRLVDRDSYGHLQHLPSHIQRARMELIIYLTSLAFKITQWGIPRKWWSNGAISVFHTKPRSHKLTRKNNSIKNIDTQRNRIQSACILLVMATRCFDKLSNYTRLRQK